MSISVNDSDLPSASQPGGQDPLETSANGQGQNYKSRYFLF